MNAIIAIHPYKAEGLWVFDDEKVGLVQEPFVAGADDIIERMVSGIENAEQGFTLLFSADPFPGHQAVFEWRRSETGGTGTTVRSSTRRGGSARRSSGISSQHQTRYTLSSSPRKACQAPNNAMQTDKVKLSRLLLTQKPRQLAFAADRER